MGNRVSSTGDTRTIKLGLENASQFPDNEVVSSKYTLLTFVPKNLFEQFRRIANFYFLCMGLISIFIDSPVSPLTSILPLIFVVVVTAAKQAYEDYLRHKADREVNNYPVTVLRNGKPQEIPAKKIQVGDLVKLENEQDVPCDIVLLISSHKESKCFVTTANLDGETNLKTLFCPKSLKRVLSFQDLCAMDATIECESPSENLYRFNGRLECTRKTSTLLRQSMMARQQSMRSLYSVSGARRPPIREETRLDCCLPDCSKCDRPTKTSFEELELRPVNCKCSCSTNRRHSTPEDDCKRTLRDLETAVKRLDEEGGERRSTSLSDVKRQEEVLSKIHSTPEIGKKQFGPQRHDSLHKSAVRRHKKTGSNVSRVSFNVEPRPSVLDRRESWNLERKESIISHRQSSLLSSKRPSLATAEGGIADPLGAENLLLRGARLKNTEYIYGCVVYTGQETKLAKNSKVTSSKFSTIERSINKFLIFFLVMLVLEVLLSVGVMLIFETHPKFNKKLRYTDGDEYKITFSSFMQNFFAFFVLYNYIIPISLYTTVELQKFLGTLFFEWDLTMYDEKTQEPAVCNTSDLNEELGQVEYLFTDKTGTLTENNMQFRRCYVDGKCFLQRKGGLYEWPLDKPEDDLGEPIDLKVCEPEMERLLLALSLCHTVQVIETPEGDERQYSASSPDEKALVEAMRDLDIIFANDEDELVVLEIFGTEKIYRKLEVMEFTSDRKRMSVIVETEEDEIFLYCKGAESAVIPLVTKGSADETLAQVEEFAKRGLRTLVVGYRILTEEEYEKISLDIQKARQTLSSNRETVVAETYQKIEHGLTVLGATGVEDELQEGVQQTLENLRAAGIKVWILTGDKVETAENISLSCGHLKPDTTKLYLVGANTPESCTEQLKKLKCIVDESPASYGLIVDGESLRRALVYQKDLFREVCTSCEAVVCCRMSPLQKSEVVQLVKNQKSSPVTAAVGDGANDVSMIQEAHVGLGIMGKEGRQAVRSSDFAFSKFKFLQPALLVHGHWYYLRAATLVQYFFYKNLAFITPQLYFLFYNGYSTQNLYDSMYLTCFNIFFTSIPILAYGLFEQDYSAEELLSNPKLYSTMAKNALMTWSNFFKWFFMGLWHSIVVFFLPAYYRMSIGNNIGQFGTLVFHLTVIIVNFKLFLHSRYWSWPFVITIALSLVALLLISTVYAVVYIPYITSDIYWVYIQLMSSGDFWLLILLSCAVCLIPDLLIDSLLNTKFSMPCRKRKLKTISNESINVKL